MPGQDPLRTKRREIVGRVLERALAIYGAAIFAILWAGMIVGLANGDSLFADTWAWLTSLEPLAAVAAWVLFLPIAVGLWAWSAGLAQWATVLVLVGLVAWTGIAINGFMRTFWRRSQRISR